MKNPPPPRPRPPRTTKARRKQKVASRLGKKFDFDTKKKLVHYRYAILTYFIYCFCAVVKGKKKAAPKVEKPVEVKVDKKPDKKKAKPAAPAPVASSSKKADKAKKAAPVATVSDKRTMSTRKKGRK